MVSGAGPAKRGTPLIISRGALQAGQGRIRHGPRTIRRVSTIRPPMTAQISKIKGRKMMGGSTVRAGLAAAWILMQMAAEDDDAAADFGAAGKGNVAAEDQNIAGDRSAEKNISGENPHAACGAPLNIGGAEKAAGVVKSLLQRQQNVVAKVDYVR